MELNNIKNEKKEIICLIFENIELKILIRVLNKKEKIKKIDTNIKEEDNDIKKRNRIFTQYNGCNNFNKPGLSIQERIKIFNGEFIKKNIYKNQIIPGKLKIPEVFLKYSNNSKDNNGTKDKKKNE